MPIFYIDFEFQIDSSFLRSPYGFTKLYLSDCLLYLSVLAFVYEWVFISDDRYLFCILVLLSRCCFDLFFLENVTSTFIVDPPVFKFPELCVFWAFSAVPAPREFLYMFLRDLNKSEGLIELLT